MSVPAADVVASTKSSQLSNPNRPETTRRAPRMSNEARRSGGARTVDEPILDEVPDLIDGDRAVKQLVQPRGGGFVTVAVGGDHVVRHAVVLRDLGRGDRGDMVHELRPAVEAVVARERELGVGELRARHRVETFFRLFAELFDRGTWRKRGHGDLLSRAPASARQAERRSKLWSNDRLRWARPFPRTGCVLKRGSEFSALPSPYGRSGRGVPKRGRARRRTLPAPDRRRRVPARATAGDPRRRHGPRQDAPVDRLAAAPHARRTPSGRVSGFRQAQLGARNCHRRARFRRPRDRRDSARIPRRPSGS